MNVMISYRSTENKWMRGLASFFESKGIKPWIDRGGIRYGFPWRLELLNELKTCDACVPLLSKKYLRSEHCRMEIFIARSFGRQILPVMVEDCFRELRKYEETRGLEDLFMMRMHRLRSVGLPITRRDAFDRIVAAVKRPSHESNSTRKVYISYTIPDAVFATQLAASLGKKGVSTWIATRDCVVGENWRDAQARAMLRARSHLVILGNGMTKDDVLRTEILLAEAQGLDTLTVVPPRLTKKPRTIDLILRALNSSDLTYRRLAAVQHIPCEHGLDQLAKQLANVLSKPGRSKQRTSHS